MSRSKTKKRIVKDYEFTGLGFPVILSEVELVQHGADAEDCYPDINSRWLQDTVFDFLIDNAVQLTGAQLAFIRHYMDMKQDDLARALDLKAHGRISQWEQARNKVADIRPVYLAALRAVMASFRGRRQLSPRFVADIIAGHIEKPKPIRLKRSAA